jgi:WXG100 family type VII secretion target
MSTSGFSAQAGDLNRIGTDCSNTAETLTAKFTTLRNDLEPLRGMWVGAGGTAFEDVRNNLDTQLGKLNIALLVIGEALTSSGTDYTITDEELQSEMRRAGAGVEALETAAALNPDGGAR